MKWHKSTYMGAHEWVSYDEITFGTWDKWARRIMYEGVDVPRSFRGGKPKLYRYYAHTDGYTYWIVGKILNRKRKKRFRV